MLPTLQTFEWPWWDEPEHDRMPREPNPPATLLEKECPTPSQKRKSSEESKRDIRVWRAKDGCFSQEGSCNCRKCSVISLSDVEPREVHTMIKFIKQNKVQRVGGRSMLAL